MSRKENYFQTQLFKPSKVRNVDGTSKIKNVSLASSAQDTFGSLSPTGSFRFDPAGSGIKNTQQLNIDFSKFENHTFFNSGRNKVHIAFEKIINTFPFDGTRKSHEDFFNNLTGFEKYVFDSFPKHTGFLVFSRSLETEGNYLSVTDYEGLGNDSSVKPITARPKLDFKDSAFSIEFSIFVPSGSINDNEVVAQRLESETRGFTIGLSSSAESNSPEGETDLIFAISDDDKSINTSMTIDKGKFKHIAAVYDRGGSNKFLIYVNGKLKKTSTSAAQLGGFNFVGTKLLIGSGSKHKYTGLDFTPRKTMSGALDEFRFFTSARKGDDIKKYRKRELFAQDDLALYFRFNEPSGTFDKNGAGNKSLVIDYSGNGMHTNISNFNMRNRDNSLVSVTSHIIEEDKSRSPVLFPSYKPLQDLAKNLIASASQYDSNNPNLITKWVPKHYLDDSAIYQGMSKTDGTLSESPGMRQDKPGGNQFQQAQLVSSVLFMWASFFDEIKMFIDELGRALKVDYLDDQTIADHLIPHLARYHGFTLPSQFNSTTVDQFLEGRSLTANQMSSNLSLQKIQNTIWKRILTDLPEIRKTKGTKASFRSVLRNMGINPDGPFRIREYGGSKTTKIGDSYEDRKEVAAMLTFSGTLSSQGTLDGMGFDPKRPVLTSQYLSSSRLELGYPKPAGTITTLGSTNQNDGLLTSGSWTAEGVFKFESKIKHAEKQSLMRIQTTGSSGNVTNNWLLFNVVANKKNIKTDTTGSVELYGCPLSGSNENILRLNINNVDIFDGNKWHVSFGRERNDKNNHHSSSYFLRVGKQTPLSFYITESKGYYADKAPNPLSVISASNNASGAYIAIGSMSLGYNTSDTIKHLNGSSIAAANYVDFSGKVSGLRFFTKALTKKETMTHIKNFKSIGLEDPKENFSFVNSMTGTNKRSFERLRVDLSLDQIVTQSDSSGVLRAFDFSQNLFHGSIQGLESNRRVIHPETFDYRIFTPKFETSRADNKIRVRSYLNPAAAADAGIEVAPLYKIPEDEEPVDDRRFEIEISTVQALNEDIMNIFATLDFFDNAIGDPELIFSREYRDLRYLRSVYFNRLDDKISIKKFFEFFKWFDHTVGDIFEELVPRSSRYLGTNFIIENHALERPKFNYNYTDMYLGELDRRNGGLIFLQQFIGSLKKF